MKDLNNTCNRIAYIRYPFRKLQIESLNILMDYTW